jgi:sugar lactone lactonase YvrE
MKAYVKKARLLLHVAAVVGMAACSKESSNQTDDQGIGLSHIAPVANSDQAQTPYDAVPSPDGKDVYFLATTTQPDADNVGTERVPGVFKAVQGAAPQLLAKGAPLQAPFGITISDDGQTLFIADTGADTSDDRSDGKVFTLGVGGGTPAALMGTEGMAPAGVEVQGGSLYITGRKDGQAGLFKTGLGGGMVSPLATGGPFIDPGGVAVAHDGTAYVVDTGAAMGPQALASVIKVTADGKTEVIKDGLSVGHPAGIALTSDDSAILVSALDGATANDRVFRIELADRHIRQLSDPIGAFYESAGLHRARSTDVFAWADSHANKTGTVYVLAK